MKRALEGWLSGGLVSQMAGFQEGPPSVFLAFWKASLLAFLQAGMADFEPAFYPANTSLFQHSGLLTGMLSFLLAFCLSIFLETWPHLLRWLDVLPACLLAFCHAFCLALWLSCLLDRRNAIRLQIQLARQTESL